MTNLGSIVQAGIWMAVSALLMLAALEPVAVAPKHEARMAIASAAAVIPAGEVSL